LFELNFVKSITERDIDFIMLEELSINTEFQEWFASRVFGERIFKAQIGAWHSVNDSNLGETDLLFIFESMEESRIALLIENKVDAIPQPKQGERYQLRGKSGQQEGYWDTYRTCVIAPLKYLHSSKHSKSYDVEISYEELFSFFQSRSSRDKRFQFKANILIEGIQKNRRGYQPEYNEEITNFVTEYYNFTEINYPELKMQKAKPRPAGSTWITFYPDSIPKGIDLVHQITAGRIKVFVYANPDEFETIKEMYLKNVPDGSEIEFHAKSVSFYIPIKKIDPFEHTFKEQEDIVREALLIVSLFKEMIEKTA